MKLTSLTLLSIFLLSLSFTACTKKPETPKENDAHQQANNTNPSPRFGNVKRPDNNVTCLNCYATFKLSKATQKQSHDHSYLACPVCKKDYSKKSN